jgi:hypothetical protein
MEKDVRSKVPAGGSSATQVPFMDGPHITGRVCFILEQQFPVHGLVAAGHHVRREVTLDVLPAGGSGQPGYLPDRGDHLVK